MCQHFNTSSKLFYNQKSKDRNTIDVTKYREKKRPSKPRPTEFQQDEKNQHLRKNSFEINEQ